MYVSSLLLCSLQLLKINCSLTDLVLLGALASMPQMKSNRILHTHTSMIDFYTMTQVNHNSLNSCPCVVASHNESDLRICLTQSQ